LRHDGREADRADTARVRAAALARAERRKTAHAPGDPPRGLGPGLRRGVPLPPRLRLPAPAKARAGPRAAGVSADRARRRLPAGLPIRRRIASARGLNPPP